MKKIMQNVMTGFCLTSFQYAYPINMNSIFATWFVLDTILSNSNNTILDDIAPQLAVQSHQYNLRGTTLQEQNLKEKQLLRYIEQDSNNFKAIENLINSGININAQDDAGQTALMYAAKKDNCALVEFLIENGADLAMQDYVGQTALMKAIEYQQRDIVALMLWKRVDINAVDKDGSSPLMLAIDVEIIKLLLSQGADVNALDKNGQTLLMRAAANNDLQLVQLFLDFGAKPNIIGMADDPSVHGKTAQDFATDQKVIDAISTYAAIQSLKNPHDSYYYYADEYSDLVNTMPHYSSENSAKTDSLVYYGQAYDDFAR